jgi:hypothetical protein
MMDSSVLICNSSSLFQASAGGYRVFCLEETRGKVAFQFSSATGHTLIHGDGLYSGVPVYRNLDTESRTIIRSTEIL